MAPLLSSDLERPRVPPTKVSPLTKDVVGVGGGFLKNLNELGGGGARL